MIRNGSPKQKEGEGDDDVVVVEDHEVAKELFPPGRMQKLTAEVPPFQEPGKGEKGEVIEIKSKLSRLRSSDCLATPKEPAAPVPDAEEGEEEEDPQSEDVVIPPTQPNEIWDELGSESEEGDGAKGVHKDMLSEI